MLDCRVLVPCVLVFQCLLTPGCSPPAASPASTPAVGPASGGAPGASADPGASLLSVAGLDPGFLNDDGRKRLVSVAADQPCACPAVKTSLAACASGSPPACRLAPLAVRAVARGIKDGDDDAEIGERLVERFTPRAPVTLDLEGTPCKGPQGAAATVVVFSDFQCPYCAMGARLVNDLSRRAAGRVRVCYKFWPLTRIHPLARQAALAAVAAHKQGKFWPYHDILYANRTELEPSDLIRHAEEVGLDIDRLATDMASPATAALVDRDAAEARRIELSGTPSFLVNGRPMTDPKSLDFFMDWVEGAELRRSIDKP